MIRVADYIMERLCVDGAKHIFMVTGRGVLFLSDAVAAHKRKKGKIGRASCRERV